MTKQITLILDGVEQVATIPSKTAAKEKAVDTGVYTLSTKNALKFSVNAMEKLGVKLGDEVTYIIVGDRHFLAKTTPELGEGFAITKLGDTQNYKRLNHPVLWAALKGNDKTINRFELSDPITSKDGLVVFELLFKETIKKKVTNGKRKPATGKGNNASVKRLRPVQVDNMLTFDLPVTNLSKAN
ncbi:hypothetical protein [Flavobacterium sp. ABG]|uniref:hypothetical protein n=1 Tax=Flavobacterium sp. ABG TaxID=1423322 RepID=UPI00064AAFB3|nr:hypothetical protein [Flavobacterium sp. ABG]KLT69916.1 hypothetical protein AB674_09435 [Flavobacterium sp. ABG]